MRILSAALPECFMLVNKYVTLTYVQFLAQADNNVRYIIKMAFSIGTCAVQKHDLDYMAR